MFQRREQKQAAPENPDTPLSEGDTMPGPSAPVPPDHAPDKGQLFAQFLRILKKTAIPSAAGTFLVMALNWSNVIEYVDGAWRLTPDRQLERERQTDKIDRTEQYALIARFSGYYECSHCPFKLIWLNQGDVWKYGVTNQGERGRYTADFIRKNGLIYTIQLAGTYSECLIEEKRKLFDYPLLPQNLIRPDSVKLILPPGNLQLR